MKGSRKIVSPRDHKCGEVRDVLEPLVAAGWRLTEGGHKWLLWCPCGCSRPISVPGTPDDCGNAARRLARATRRCTGAGG